MTSEQKLYQINFSKVYPLYIQKAERKGRTKKEVDQIISWLTGYKISEIHKIAQSQLNFEAVFNAAPAFNPKANLIKGSICGIKVEEISDPLAQKIRYLDKLIDELAKGKPIEKILRK